MPFQLLQTQAFEAQCTALQQDPTRAGQAAWKAVLKALRLLAANPRHPGLHTHEYHSLAGPRGEKVFEAYAQNKTPGAWRIFWHYGPGPDTITLLAVTPHP